LNTTNVIGGSGSFSTPGTFTPGQQFSESNILDDQSGPVQELSQSGYWLNPDNGPANAYITVDLGAAYNNLQFELFNTSNAYYQDRGTGNFTIVGGNSVMTDLVSGGLELTGPTTTLVTGTLAAATATEAASTAGIPGQIFTSIDPGYFRYFEFEPTSVAAGGTSCCGANNYGLDEIRAFQTPEPGSVVALVGLVGMGLVGLGLRRRHQSSLATKS
jgi:hypothetical protein